MKYNPKKSPQDAAFKRRMQRMTAEIKARLPVNDPRDAGGRSSQEYKKAPMPKYDPWRTAPYGKPYKPPIWGKPVQIFKRFINPNSPMGKEYRKQVLKGIAGIGLRLNPAIAIAYGGYQFYELLEDPVFTVPYPTSNETTDNGCDGNYRVSEYAFNFAVNCVLQYTNTTNKTTVVPEQFNPFAPAGYQWERRFPWHENIIDGFPFAGATHAEHTGTLHVYSNASTGGAMDIADFYTQPEEYLAASPMSQWWSVPSRAAWLPALRPFTMPIQQPVPSPQLAPKQARRAEHKRHLQVGRIEFENGTEVEGENSTTYGGSPKPPTTKPSTSQGYRGRPSSSGRSRGRVKHRPHYKKRPRNREREKKIRVSGMVYKAFHAYGVYTEFEDFVDILYFALPEEIRKHHRKYATEWYKKDGHWAVKLSTAAKVVALYHNYRAIDGKEFWKNWHVNAVGEAQGATYGKVNKRLSQELELPWGLQFGSAFVEYMRERERIAYERQEQKRLRRISYNNEEE